jgi:hypothetical protein
MYLHDLCGFDPTYTRSQSPSGPATTPQNGSSCGTVGFLAAAEREKRLRPRKGAAFPLRAGNSAKIWTPPHLKLRRPHPPRLTDPPSLLLRWALPVPVAGFEERMISSLYFTIKREPPNECVCCGRPQGKHSPAPSRERGVGSNKHLLRRGPQAPGPPLLLQ